ncbi:MAG: hypothetical protein JWR42_2026 [Marmoricola sp.]|nr:hypothetical protein [Marmoricola sp.]
MTSQPPVPPPPYAAAGGPGAWGPHGPIGPAGPPGPPFRGTVEPLDPTSYPLALRTPTYAWWKPVVGVLSMGLGFFLLPYVVLPVLALGVALEDLAGMGEGGGSFGQRLIDAAQVRTVTPASMLFLNLSLAGLTLLAMLLVRLVHGLSPRWLASIRPGIRWRFLAVCFGLSIVAILAALVVGSLLPQDPNDLGGGPKHATATLVAIGVVVLLTTPFQALGEEYAFRGYLLQAAGALTRSRVLAVVVTSVLFALAHGVQNAPLFVDRLAFGLMAGLVVVLVGGLEAGIALHVVNNILAFGLALFFGDITAVLKVSEASWWQLPVTLTQNGLYLVMVLLVARRTHLLGDRSTRVQEAVHQPSV